MEKTVDILKDYIRTKIKLLESNIGAVTWISTITVALSTAFIKLMWYIIERGKLAFLKIDSSVISILGDNTLYNIVISIVFSTIISLIMLLPFFIIKSKKKIRYKIFTLLLVFIGFSVFLFLISDAWVVLKGSGIFGICIFILAALISFIIFFIPSLVFGLLSIFKPKSAEKLSVKGFVIILFMCFLFYCVLAYISGYFSMQTQKNYRIIDESYAIIYETEESFYLAEYNSDTSLINCDKQKIISKDNVVYYWEKGKIKQ